MTAAISRAVFPYLVPSLGRKDIRDTLLDLSPPLAGGGRGRGKLKRSLLVHILHMAEAMYIEEKPSGVTIKVRVSLRSSSAQITGPRGDVLGIKLTSPPVEGRANEELIGLLAKRLRVARSSIRIVTGHSSREKVLFVEGVDRAYVMERLGGQ